MRSCAEVGAPIFGFGLCSLRPAARHCQHWFAEVQSSDLDSTRRQGKSNIARARTEIKRALSRLRSRQSDQAAFPGPMQPKALEVVHQIVTRRNCGKQIRHFLG